MKKQVTVEEVRTPISICGYKQNCYRLDRNIDLSSSVTSTPNKEQEKYESLEKQMLPNGYVEGIVFKDYPINSKSVSSLAEGADYRNDPLQAISQASSRVNLGDITEAQKFLENPQNNARIFSYVKEKIAEYYAKNPPKNQSMTARSETTEGNSVNNEVNNG